MTSDSRRFNPDPPPDLQDPILIEWLMRQFERINQSLDQVSGGQDGGGDLLDDHLSDTGNPHGTRHDNLADGQVNVAAHWPAGGDTGQVAAKASGTDYDLEWTNAAVNVKGEAVPGTGAIHDDVNAHCFSGPHSDGSCRMCIGDTDLLYIGHNDIIYMYIGPSSVCIGSGGAGGSYPHRVTVAGDWVLSGTQSHSALSNRDAADSHPQTAVGARGAQTNLKLDQDAQDARIAANEAHVARTDNPHGVQHSQLADRGTNTHVTIDAHLASTSNPHGVTHAQLQDKGTNDHAAIDSHIADALIHFQDVPLDGNAYARRDRAWVAASSLSVMYGAPTNKTLGAGGFRVDGWDGAAESGLMEGAGNATTGQFTVPVDGVYSLLGHIHGDQGNDTKEESIWLDIREIGGASPGDTEVCHESVDTDKTTSRTLSFSATRYFQSGTILELRMRASAGLGTFDFVACTWEIEKLV